MTVATNDDEALFPVLSPEQLALLEPFGTRRSIAPGDVLFAEGDASYDFFVVLSGLVDILGHFDGEDVLIAQHGAGRFLGELNLLTGQRVYLTARVVEGGEVLAVPVAGLRQVIARLPSLCDIILGAFVARREGLLSGAARAVRVIGSRFSAESLAMREFLARNRLPHQWLDVERDPEVDRLGAEFGLTGVDLPVVIIGTTVLRRATPGEVSQYLGLTVESLPGRCFDLVVIGAGPAGLAASVYGASEGLTTLTVEAALPGGQAGTSSRIENYLGFPAGVSGAELTDRATTQALKFGARLTVPCRATALGERAGHLVVGLSDGTELAGRAVVVASGAQYRRLPVDRLAEFEGLGVYYAATEVEANLVRETPVVVVGGGNSAGQAALFLAASGCPVTLVMRGSELGKSMSRYLADRIEAHPAITVRTGTTVGALHGHDVLDGVTLDVDGRPHGVPAAGLFSFIGAVPSTDWLSGRAALDPAGFIRTDRALGPDDLDDAWTTLGRTPLPFESSQPGLFAVGDVRAGSMKRVASAVGEGSAAVRSVHEHLAFHG